MALDIDSSPPPIFRQGLPALSRLVLFGLLSVLLMSADHRLGLSQPIRSAVSVVLAPLQWAVLLPERYRAMPDVPTLTEAGYPAVDIVPWGGFVVPASTPREMADVAARELRAAFDARPPPLKMSCCVAAPNASAFPATSVPPLIVVVPVMSK